MAFLCFIKVWDLSRKDLKAAGDANSWGCSHLKAPSILVGNACCCPGSQLGLSAGTQTQFLHMDFPGVLITKSECLDKKYTKVVLPYMIYLQKSHTITSTIVKDFLSPFWSRGVECFVNCFGLRKNSSLWKLEFLLRKKV